MSHILEVQVYSRGKEVYGLSYPKSEFNQKKFLEDHKDDYYELSRESLESYYYYHAQPVRKIP